MIAFVEGKRIAVDPEARTVTVQGRAHADSYAFEAAQGRVKLYRDLAAKHRTKQFYAASLAAAERAAQMVAEVDQ